MARGIERATAFCLTRTVAPRCGVVATEHGPVFYQARKSPRHEESEDGLCITRHAQGLTVGITDAHGVTRAGRHQLVIEVAQSLIAAIDRDAHEDRAPAETLTDFHQRLCRGKIVQLESDEIIESTALVGRFYPHRRAIELDYAGGGTGACLMSAAGQILRRTRQPSELSETRPWYWRFWPLGPNRKSRQILERFHPSAFREFSSLGMPDFRLEQESWPVEPGQILLFYSDGLSGNIPELWSVTGRRRLAFDPPRGRNLSDWLNDLIERSQALVPKKMEMDKRLDAAAAADEISFYRLQAVAPSRAWLRGARAYLKIAEELQLPFLPKSDDLTVAAFKIP